MTANISRLQDQVNRLERRIHSLEHELGSKELELDRKSREVASLTDKLEQMTVDYEEAKSFLDDGITFPIEMVRAILRLKDAGLNVKVSDNGEIRGYGWIDRSQSINIVHDSFFITREPNGLYDVLIGLDKDIANDHEQVSLPINEAVDLIIEKVKPGINIEPNKPLIQSGTCYY